MAACSPRLRWSIQDASEPELIRRWSMDDAIALGENAFHRPSSMEPDGKLKKAFSAPLGEVFMNSIPMQLSTSSYSTTNAPGQAEKEVKTKGFIELPSMEDGQPARAPVNGRCRWMRKASAKRWTMVDGRRGRSASMVLGHDGVSEVKEVTAGDTFT